ncbi:VWA domain-containing protein [Janibacter limosus]|uniref:VWA domain-containing protein n=1 Tax=Janibacter limosus TaxID=53458 RepID=A0AC61U1Y1_9MICO|nr:VWA domain-containing protein [Janibacter limosus]UUZ44020.1 VWA domain-containing protein [Janibacter limosus]
MLDASGSMKEKDASGGTKMAAAKEALTTVVDGLPAGTDVGLRVYGATEEGGKPTKAACADTQLVAPIKPLDKPGLTKAIKGFEAKGETPIAHSLAEGLKDLGDSGPRNIILVSDGEESCVPDPCPVVQKLVKDGVDLRIDTVGFDVDGTARKQLQCLADAGDGKYYDAADSGELATSLTKLSQQAVRQFSARGTPISMTTDTTSAPTMVPGRYTDTFSAGDKPRHARITRTPNSIVHIGFVVRPPSERDMFDEEDWELSLTTPDGEECDTERESGTEFFRSGSSLTMAVSANNRVTRPADGEPCATSDELLLTVTHDEGKGSDLPVQIAYVEEPAVTDVDSLPEAPDAKTLTGLTAKGDGSPPRWSVEVVSPMPRSWHRAPTRRRSSRVSSCTTGSGSTSDNRPRSRPRSDRRMVSALRITWASRSTPGTPHSTRPPACGPRAGRRTAAALDRAKNSIVLGEFVPEVRYRNKESTGNFQTAYDDLPKASLPGYYYFAVGREHATGTTEEGPVTVRIDVDVNGTVTGLPNYVGAAAPASGTTSSDSSTSPADDTATTDGAATDAGAEDEGGGLPLPWIGGGLLAALVLGAGGWLALRGRGTRS